jgi:S-adenosylmethionine:tRNA ribosyltransferase-isomerase
MDLSDLDYPLPKDLIAQRPLDKRDSSRLLVAHRKDTGLEDRVFSDVLDYLKPGDVLVLNDTKVVKARVLGKKKGTGGKVDALFLEEAAPGRWKCLIQPALKEGHIVEFPRGVEGAYAGRDKEGMVLLELQGAQDMPLWLEACGTVPLPPYMKREPGKEDESTYQTVYAKKEGAVAAPTAGLHWTQDLLERVRKMGVEVRHVTLHVGYGTFKPVEDLENHQMHSERFELTEEVADALNRAKSEKRNVWAVGTTALRVLETCVVKKRFVAGKGETNLYIYPPFKFEAVDRLITNFHLPKTTLLLLVAAFMGESFRKKAYAHAIEKKYRFYSYGDAMLIL